jgi:hypothetical protein
VRPPQTAWNGAATTWPPWTRTSPCVASAARRVASLARSRPRKTWQWTESQTSAPRSAWRPFCATAYDRAATAWASSAAGGAFPPISSGRTAATYASSGTVSTTPLARRRTRRVVSSVASKGMREAARAGGSGDDAREEDAGAERGGSGEPHAAASSRRAQARRGVGVRLGALAPEHRDGVRQRRGDRLEALHRAARGAREVHDERLPADPCDLPREHRRGERRPARGAHRLRQSRQLEGDHGARRLGRHVALGDPRTAGRQDDVDEDVVREAGQVPDDVVLLVRDDLRLDDLGAEEPAGRLGNGGSAPVFPLPAERAVGDGQDGDTKGRAQGRAPRSRTGNVFGMAGF